MVPSNEFMVKTFLIIKRKAWLSFNNDDGSRFSPSIMSAAVVASLINLVAGKFPSFQKKKTQSHSNRALNFRFENVILLDGLHVIITLSSHCESTEEVLIYSYYYYMVCWMLEFDISFHLEETNVTSWYFFIYIEDTQILQPRYVHLWTDSDPPTILEWTYW